MTAALESLRGARGPMTADQVELLAQDLGNVVTGRLAELGVVSTRDTALAVGIALVGVAGAAALTGGACPQNVYAHAIMVLKKGVLLRGCNCPDRPIEARVNARGGAS